MVTNLSGYWIVLQRGVGADGVRPRAGPDSSAAGNRSRHGGAAASKPVRPAADYVAHVTTQRVRREHVGPPVWVPRCRRVRGAGRRHRGRDPADAH